MMMRRTPLLMALNGGFLCSRQVLRKPRHTCAHAHTKKEVTAPQADGGSLTPPSGTYLTQDQRHHHRHEQLGEDGREGNGGRRTELGEEEEETQGDTNTNQTRIKGLFVGFWTV